MILREKTKCEKTINFAGEKFCYEEKINDF